MARMSTRTGVDRAEGIQRMIRALWRDPREWDVTELYLLSRMEQDIAILREGVVRALRDQGVTDKQIGEALGITQQAVSKRWPGGGRYVGAAGRYRKPKEDT